MNEPLAGEQSWWRLDFYHDRSRRLARFRVQARLPTTATVIGRQQLLAAYPSHPGRRRDSLFSQAQLTDGVRDGWTLYRIVKEP